MKCFVVLSNNILWFQLKNKTNYEENYLLDAALLTNLSRFQDALPDHVQVESLSCCFDEELHSFF